MKKYFIFSLLILSTCIVSAQDIVPDHTAKTYEFKENVKSVSEYKYSYHNNKYTNFSENQYLFNEQGNLTKLLNRETGLADKLLRYTYDSNHRITKYFDISDKYGDIIEEYVYDEKGNIVTINEGCDDSLYGYKITHKVINGANGKPKIREEYIDDKLDRFTTYTYSGNNLTELLTKNADGKEQYRYKYTYWYDLIQEYTYHKDSITTKLSYKYNKDKKLSYYKTSTYECSIDYLEKDNKGNWYLERYNYTYFKDSAKYTDIVCRKFIYHDGYMSGRTETKTYDAFNNYNSLKYSDATIKKNDGTYTLKVDELNNYDLKSVMVGKSKDLLIYEKNSDATFLVSNYTDIEVGTTVTPTFLGRHLTYWCKGEDGGYWLYYNGMLQNGTVSSWVGDDLLVYSPSAKKTFLLGNYKTADINKAKSAQDITTDDNIYYYKADDGYFLFKHGRRVTKNLSSFFLGDHLIIFKSDSYDYIKLINYKNLDTKSLGVATIPITWYSHIAIRTNANGSVLLYLKGEKIDGISAVFDGYDLVISHKDYDYEIKVYDYLFSQPQDFLKAIKTYK